MFKPVSLLIPLAAAVPMGCSTPSPGTYDVVVYGGTASGAVAAIAAADEGLRVALVEPRTHIGGMVTGGLGQTDFGKKETIGGMSREFFQRVGKHYGQPIAWHFEPHVAERVFRDWLDQAGVDVFFNHRLAAVHARDSTIHRIDLENGCTFTAKVFIDAGYEGDLMARAGVSYTWGREGQDQYGESLAGVREKTPKHQFDVPISAYDEDGQLLPCIYPGDPGKPGQADRKVQAYNFRICMCSRKDNQVPFPRPADYDPRRYELLNRYLATRGKDLNLNDIMIVSPMPGDKTDVNNRGPFSSDHIGGSWDYPEADYEKRRQIWDDHVSYVQGWLYFLANDPSVPRHLHDAINQWGLAKDEFIDTDHWPHQLYIREARRMVGRYVMKQSDLQTDRTKPDGIGMGSYNSDSHNVQRIVGPDGFVTNEGDMQVPVRPYEIAYRSLTPKPDECGNLLVTGCVSASHVAYSSIRMEPVYMIMGHAAGVAASYAVRYDAPVQQIDTAWLRDRLGEQKQILSMRHMPIPYAASKELPGIVVDNTAAQLVGEWFESSSVGPYIDHDYLHDNNAGKGEKRVRFIPNLPKAGRYTIYLAYTANPNRATNVPVTINTTNGPKTVKVNQREQPPLPPFTSIGAYELSAGQAGYVEIATTRTDGHVIADAVQWLPVR